MNGLLKWSLKTTKDGMIWIDECENTFSKLNLPPIFTIRNNTGGYMVYIDALDKDSDVLCNLEGLRLMDRDSWGKIRRTTPPMISS